MLEKLNNVNYYLSNNKMDNISKQLSGGAFVVKKRGSNVKSRSKGGSSGGAVWAAIQKAKTLNHGEKCLVILPDSIRNYLSKFVDDDWMQKQGFINS